jgi:hypothetical protein
LIVDIARNADPARLGQSFEAGSNVDAVSIDVVAFDDDVADVDADPKGEALLRRPGSLVLGESPLDLGGGQHSAYSARELDQHPVSGRLDDTTFLAGHRRLEQLFAYRLEPGVRARFVGFHQPAVADHVAARIAASRRSTAGSSAMGALLISRLRTLALPLQIAPRS